MKTAKTMNAHTRTMLRIMRDNGDIGGFQNGTPQEIAEFIRGYHEDREFELYEDDPHPALDLIDVEQVEWQLLGEFLAAAANASAA
jgi:hypothetical protein